MNPNAFYMQPARRDEDAEDDGYSFKPKRRYFPDTYLDSPIMVTVRMQWIACLTDPPDLRNPKTQFDRTLRDVFALEPNPLSYNILDPDEYSKFYHLDWQSTLDGEVEESVAVARNIYSGVSATIEAITEDSLPTIHGPTDDYSMYWLSRWSYFDSLVEQFSKISSATGPNAMLITLGDHTRVIATRDMWFLDNTTHGKFALLYDQVLMVKDLMLSRAQCYIAAHTMYPTNNELVSAVVSLCDWHESCLTRYGNVGFEILRQTEALSKAYLSEMSDTVFGSDGPYGRMLTKVKQKEVKLGADIDTCLAAQFDRLLRQCTNIQTVVELFGLLKISGHPLIDARVGGISAAAEAREADATLYEDAVKLDWEFKRVMLESYIHKWGAWPPLHFSKAGRSTVLHSLYRSQSRGLNRSSYPLEDWEQCRFKKIADFDYSPNYLELIDDKSISLYRSNIAATWNSDVKPLSHRRLLMELINREHLDIHAIVDMIVRREVPFDWFIVSLHPKEREFKIAPRMFSMLVLEIRIFFALTEANLADRIFPYLPQQTMTKSKIAISRQFLEMTKPHTATHSHRLFIEIDLSRWNLRWRGMSVNPVARTLNDMFGTPGVFDFVHEFFSQSLILVRVRELEPAGINEPSPPESDLLWYNHLGGFEGICQKLWTICTYSMVSIAVSPLPVSYTLLGQGDNQILSIVTSTDPARTEYDILSELRDEVTTRIAATCASVNQEVKVEECLESTSVITYSKDIYINGVYRPTALKFHSRLFPHSSQIFPSVRSNLGAIFSTAVAGAEKSHEPMTSYFLACFYGALYLNRISRGRGPYGKQISAARTTLGERFSEFVMFCLTLPSEAGGLPVIPFMGFTYKGGSDPLGKSLSAMNSLAKHSNVRLFNRMLSQMSDNRIYNPEPKVSSLLLDPFSIPLHKPQTSVDGVASETIEALAPKIRTLEIRELINTDTDAYLEQLVEALGECTPMNPLIMRDILDCSVAGITETVSKMFVATRTLQNVVRELGVPIIDKVLYLESMGIAYMYNRFCMIPSDKAQPVSTYDLTRQCRDRWYPNGYCPIVGLTTYQPTDFEISWGSSSFNIEGINSVLIAETDPIETRGPYDPYVGSKTREKRSEHGYKIVGTDTASKSLRKLQLISSQTGDDPHFKLLVDAVGWTRTNTTLSDISDELPGTSGGTLSHRYASRAGHQDAFNVGSPNFATHLIISTDNMGYLSGGAEDYPHMIQEQILFLNWCMQNRHLKRKDKFLCATLVTLGTVMDPLPSVTIRGPDDLRLKVRRLPNNPLAFTGSLTLQRVTGAIKHPSLVNADHFKPSEELRRHVLEAYFKTILRRSSTGRQIADGSSQHFATACLDIAEVYSNGLYNIAVAIAYVCCDEAISNFMMTDLQGVKRWRLRVYTSKIAEVMARAVTPSIGHPMLSRDPVVVKMALYDQPTYAGGAGIIHRRYTAFIGGICDIVLQGADEQYNHRTIGVFSSDNNRVLSEAYLTCLLTDLYLWRLNGTLPNNILRTMMGKELIPVVRAQHEEEEKVETLLRVVNRVSIRTQLSTPHISHTLALYRRSRVQGYKAAVEDVLKATRKVDDWGLPTIAPTKKTSDLRLPHSLPRHRDFVLRSYSATSQGTRILDMSVTPEPILLANMFLRNRGRLGALSGSAIHIWSVFAALFKSRPVIVIGSGMGAVARVALDAGCPHVFGLDLRSTIPLRSHRFRHYKPPLVQDSMYHDRYTQLPSSFTTSGDWFDNAVSEDVMTYDQGNSTIVIDIQSGALRHGLEILTPSLLKKTSGTIVMRMYLTESETRLVLSDLTVSGVMFKAYDLWRTVDIGHVVIILQKWTTEIKTAITPEVETQWYTIRELPSPHVTPRDVANALSDAVFNTVYIAETQSAGDVLLSIDRLLDEAWGDYDSRFSYEEWTRWLRAKVVIEWIMLDERDRMPKLLRWREEGTVSVRTVGGHECQVKTDWSLCRHIASQASRLV